MIAARHPRLLRQAAARAGRWSWPAPRSAWSRSRSCGATCSPTSSAPVFNVIVQNPAMGAEELEAAIAIPLEVGPGRAALRAPHPVQLAARASARSRVEFEPDADYYRARQLVAERVAQAAGQLPPGTDAPLVSSLTGRLNEIYEFTLEAEPGSADLMTLRDLAEFDVRNRLLAVPGVAAVEVLGGHLRQFQVQLDTDRLAARGVTLDEVRHALRGRQRERRRRLRGPGLDRVGGARRRPRRRRRRPAPDRGRRPRRARRCCWATWPRCARTPPSAAASRTASEARS